MLVLAPSDSVDPSDSVGPSAGPKPAGLDRDACPPRSSAVAPAGLAVAARSKPVRWGEAEETLNELVALALGGNPQATEELLATVRRMVLRYCRARLGPRHGPVGSAEDVAQDICLAVLTALARYDGRGLSFRAFVYGIAAHKVADTYRAVMRNRSEPIADFDAAADHDGPERQVLRAEQSEWLGRLLGVLSARQREVLVFRVVAGLSAAETAELVQSTPGAVRVLQHRALAQLRIAVAGLVEA